MGPPTSSTPSKIPPCFPRAGQWTRSEVTVGNSAATTHRGVMAPMHLQAGVITLALHSVESMTLTPGHTWFHHLWTSLLGVMLGFLSNRSSALKAAGTEESSQFLKMRAELGLHTERMSQISTIPTKSTTHRVIYSICGPSMAQMPNLPVRERGVVTTTNLGNSKRPMLASSVARRFNCDSHSSLTHCLNTTAGISTMSGSMSIGSRSTALGPATRFIQTTC